MRTTPFKLRFGLALAGVGLLASAASSASTYSFRVKAEGVRSAAAWSAAQPANTSFSSTNIGAFAAPDIAVAVRNTGSSAGTLGALTFLGANPGDFSATSDCANIAPSASCTITARFKPADSGVRTAALTVGTTVLNFTGIGAAAPAIPANCRKDSANEVWCVSANGVLSTTGAQVCGYPANYAGTYYPATLAAASAWGKTLGPSNDCASNYLNGASNITPRSAGTCWSATASWARPGTDSGTSVFVRCTSYE